MPRLINSLEQKVRLENLLYKYEEDAEKQLESAVAIENAAGREKELEIAKGLLDYGLHKINKYRCDLWQIEPGYDFVMDELLLAQGKISAAYEVMERCVAVAGDIEKSGKLKALSASAAELWIEQLWGAQKFKSRLDLRLSST